MIDRERERKERKKEDKRGKNIPIQEQAKNRNKPKARQGRKRNVEETEAGWRVVRGVGGNKRTKRTETPYQQSPKHNKANQGKKGQGKFGPPPQKRKEVQNKKQTQTSNEKEKADHPATSVCVGRSVSLIKCCLLEDTYFVALLASLCLITLHYQVVRTT